MKGCGGVEQEGDEIVIERVLRKAKVTFSSIVGHLVNCSCTIHDQWSEFMKKYARKKLDIELGSPAGNLFVKIAQHYDLINESNFKDGVRRLLLAALSPAHSTESSEAQWMVRNPFAHSFYCTSQH